MSFVFDAPILPGTSMAGVTVGQHVAEIYRDLKKIVYADTGNFWLEDPFYIRYEMRGFFSITVHALNGKIVKIGALQGYQGCLFDGIRVGMPLDLAMKFAPSLKYDDFEGNYFVSGVPGIAIEVSGALEIIDAITVFHPSLKGDWDETKELGLW